MNPSENWREEKRSAWLYRIISDAESGTVRQMLFLELAQAAERQAAIWVQAMQGATPEPYAPDFRARLVAWLVRRFGPRAMRSILAAMKVRGMSIYNVADHPANGHPMPTSLEQVGSRHQFMGGGNLRAAVFGVNDGLVSNASLIMGVAGASDQNGIIMLSGVAGLLAGAFSMAAGEYLSVRSQREMVEYQIALEREEVETYPEEEAAELALIFQAKGMTPDAARDLADNLIADPDRALDALTREELGLNPETLGSPWGAALFSLVSFSLGALAPLLPFFFLTGSVALLMSVAFSAVALFGVGAALSLFSGRHALLGGLRMLAIGGAAGGATYLIGRALGVTLA
ncbi:MAG: VIT1/CCC1 transporter family protein [Sulfuricellaceae bacterium]|nr:VIT1/CCC1 transporter family protein [Sulfuricellaceae bacterium]